ncbi:Phosphocarrier protein, nitrogen regulation associated [Roseibacterium elongatum DSM 19469]|uniref:Phosphocarrier protein, nitrogen regulation associated n=1 Tax=Roseicyclus elongatus DSM 19469 TaxID=1294273 RepID=W8RRX4_9RHOB|nr:HPr family phosphocarrier protein [Roseibacterium elongatum]AHM03899.1 Phosphocarrier protein, nitrogen regulation associated [Roseibacterium elongatum DSM 19469]
MTHGHTITRDLKIVNVKGLHARASARFVEVVEGHDATATVRKDGLSAAGDSIMGLLMLAASMGTTIEVETSGPEAEPLADALEDLVADRFGEGN